MLKQAASSLLRKALYVGIGLVGFMILGFFTADRKDYPGKAEFEKVNRLLGTSSKGVTHGDSEEEKAAAGEFATSMKTLQGTLFTGGSGRSIATKGDFLTYVKRTPNAVVVLCHVPELRNYKDAKTREMLTELAWSSGRAAAKKIPGIKESDTLIVGLRGFASYGPIWEGTVSGEATKKSDGPEEKKRLYPFFVATAPN